MDYIIMELLRDEIICLKDLEEFSDDLKEKMLTYAQSLRSHKQN